jgi:hypothetical protein
MLARRAKFAALLSGASAPIYFVIQLLFGADLVDSLIRALWFFLLLFLVSLAIDWDKKGAGRPEEPPSQDSSPGSS